MKLTEIINSDHIFAELDPAKVLEISQLLSSEGKSIKAITKQTDLVQHGSYYGARRADDILAWLELGDSVTLHGMTHDTISFIYVKPEHRGSFVIGSFLLALKGTLQHPLLLGSDVYGGVLFAGGEALVRSLHKSAHFEVSTLDLQTGEKTPFEISDLKGAKGRSLVFESGDFPMFFESESTNRIYLFQD